MKRYKNTKISLFALLAIAAIGCTACRGGYSFTGTSIAPDVKTVSVSYFENMAPTSTMPILSNMFTEALINKFRRQTKLELVETGGDLHFEGEITGFDNPSKAVQADEMPAMSTLSITIKVRFTNEKDDKQSYDQSFTASEDYSSVQSLDAVQDQLAPKIVETLVENIFNAAVANW